MRRVIRDSFYSWKADFFREPGTLGRGQLPWSATRTGAYMRETTKTGKGRPVALLPEAAEALKAHRARYLEERMRKA